MSIGFYGFLLVILVLANEGKSTLIWSLKNSKLSCSRINYMIFFNELQLQPWLKSIKTIVYSGVGWQKISVCHAHCLHTPFNQQRNATEQHASLWVRLSQGVSFKLSDDKTPDAVTVRFYSGCTVRSLRNRSWFVWSTCMCLRFWRCNFSALVHQNACRLRRHEAR